MVGVNAPFSSLNVKHLEFGSKENGDHAGGITDATSWIKLGK
ncbi:MAG: hypothetical protein ACI9T7_000170 [Oleiphilaceae bacterium]